MKRLFVAVPVSEEIAKEIKPVLSALAKTGTDLKLVSLFNLHFTLKFLGEVDEKKIPEIEKKLRKVADKTTSFDLSVKGVGVFPSLERISVIWVGTEDSELVSLMKIIGKELDPIRKNDHQEEVAHLTIARVKTSKGKEKLQQFVKRFEKKEFGKMAVDKLILYESELTGEGPVYKVVKEFKLK
ncbi:MAG: RNA 2',3'-cyclic phosphodiesterase [Nanoarchaeota archaeon]|nr:RNA 2',3'-cyclic phosphodiesterase [Nanoarchaeota archaeon]